MASTVLQALHAQVRQTSGNKKGEERTTVAPQQRGKSGLKGLHDSLVKERRSGACTSTHVVGCSLEGSARNLKLRMHRVYSRKTSQASEAFTMVSAEKHAAQAGEVAGYGLQVSGQILDQGVVVGGLRVVLLGYGEGVEGKPAGERKGELVKRRQAPAPRWRGQTVTAHRCPCCSRHRQNRCRCSKPTLNGARELDTKSRATSSVWCGVAPDGGASPAGVALLRRRLRRASDKPSERQTRWDQQLQREARTVRSFGPRQPHSVTRRGR